MGESGNETLPVIAVAMGQSLEALVAVLGVTKAGFAYLPIDTGDSCVVFALCPGRLIIPHRIISFLHQTISACNTQH